MCVSPRNELCSPRQRRRRQGKQFRLMSAEASIEFTIGWMRRGGRDRDKARERERERESFGALSRKVNFVLIEVGEKNWKELFLRG